MLVGERGLGVERYGEGKGDRLLFQQPFFFYLRCGWGGRERGLVVEGHGEGRGDRLLFQQPFLLFTLCRCGWGEEVWVHVEGHGRRG